MSQTTDLIGEVLAAVFCYHKNLIDRISPHASTRTEPSALVPSGQTISQYDAQRSTLIHNLCDLNTVTRLSMEILVEFPMEGDWIYHFDLEIRKTTVSREMLVRSLRQYASDKACNNSEGLRTIAYLLSQQK